MEVTVGLEGLSFYAYHGYYEEERRTGNRFLVDIKIETSQNDNVDFDNIENTINYEEVYSIINAQMGIPSKLLENVAKKILDDTYNKWPFVLSVEISISKLSAPVGGPCRNAKVTLKR